MTGQRRRQHEENTVAKVHGQGVEDKGKEAKEKRQPHDRLPKTAAGGGSAAGCRSGVTAQQHGEHETGSEQDNDQVKRVASGERCQRRRCQPQHPGIRMVAFGHDYGAAGGSGGADGGGGGRRAEVWRDSAHSPAPATTARSKAKPPMPRNTLAEPVDSEVVGAGVKMGTGRATAPLPGGGVPAGMTTAARVGRGDGVGDGSGVSGPATNGVAAANVGANVAVAAGVGTGVPGAVTCTTSERACWSLPRTPRTV